MWGCWWQVWLSVFSPSSPLDYLVLTVEVLFFFVFFLITPWLLLFRVQRVKDWADRPLRYYVTLCDLRRSRVYIRICNVQNYRKYDRYYEKISFMMMAADVFLRRISLPQPLHIHLFPHSDKEDGSVYIHQWRYVISCKFRLTSSKETEPRCKSRTPVFMIYKSWDDAIFVF